MLIHKINRKIHKEFLLQNRKDPITGDLIEENDEVVFCKECKSVFLKDSWFYLAKTHCEQTNTLSSFPVQSVMKLRSEEDILFYDSLPFSEEGQNLIPEGSIKGSWIQKKHKLSLIHPLFHNKFNYYIQIILGVISFFFIFYNKNFFPLLGTLVFVGAMNLFGFVHDWYFGGNMTSVNRIFTNNTFFISNKYLGFASKYGINQYMLPVEYINRIILSEDEKEPHKNYVQIHYKKKEALSFEINSYVFRNKTYLFNALKIFSTFQNIPIQVKSQSKETAIFIHKIRDEGGSNFKFDKRKKQK